MTRILATTLLFVLTVSMAHAHVGHVGELAGHAHWVGLAALIGAAAMAALAAKSKKNDKDRVEPEEGDSETQDNPEGASA
ncbi:MAG: hypothetical protein NXI27_05435 [Alphaproteobacteria bacterium]|nr:hypothetical protein [Alphaproteobacteria bacterium]